MRKLVVAAALAAALLPAAAQAVDYVAPGPLASVVTTPVAECPQGALSVPTIQWGADIATFFANGSASRTAPGSIFAGKGLDMTLYRQDDFVEQVRNYLSCKTPFIRGTMSMLAQASELLSRDPRTAPVIIYQLSWSRGGDTLVVKDSVKTLADLKGKTIALQAYGPHVDFLFAVLASVGLKPTDVTIKWTKDLYQQNDKSVSPAKAMHDDPSVDAAFVIYPDMQSLTSGGKVGTGSEDSVKGARMIFSTLSADHVIADVYAVRKDYFDTHRDQVQAFVSGLLAGAEQLHDLMKDRKGDAYQKMIKATAGFIMDSPTAIDDTTGLYDGTDLVGYKGNVKFFTDQKNPRNLNSVTTSIEEPLVALGFLTKLVPLVPAGWDYSVLANGLKDTAGVELTKFDTSAVQQLTETRAKQESTEGELTKFEIYFGPNQNTFPPDQYQTDFDKVIGLASTYGGALLTIEGNSDPLAYLKQKKAGANVLVLNQLRQAAKNLSQSRANAVKDSIIAYAQSKGVTLDPSQFGVVGLGVSQPNTPKCTLDKSGDIDYDCAPANTKEWNDTRRVVFKMIQIEAETSAFKPLQ